MEKARITVSPEMGAFIGRGTIVAADWPAARVGLCFRLGAATVAFHTAPVCVDDADIVLLVTSEACSRIFGQHPQTSATWLLPSDMRTIALAIRDCPLPDAAGETFRLAKCIELLCATFVNIGAAALVPAAASGSLSELDTRRLIAARHLIDERWQEKLTLDGIARACGLNRAKLTRGFRSMFSCTVADAIAERRLGSARDLLLATDLPVSLVGYRCGYLNNASFARAFNRRFGVAPTRLRLGMAA